MPRNASTFSNQTKTKKEKKCKTSKYVNKVQKKNKFQPMWYTHSSTENFLRSVHILREKNIFFLVCLQQGQHPSTHSIYSNKFIHVFPVPVWKKCMKEAEREEKKSPNLSSSIVSLFSPTSTTKIWNKSLLFRSKKQQANERVRARLKLYVRSPFGHCNGRRQLHQLRQWIGYFWHRFVCTIFSPLGILSRRFCFLKFCVCTMCACVLTFKSKRINLSFAFSAFKSTPHIKRVSGISSSKMWREKQS